MQHSTVQEDTTAISPLCRDAQGLSTQLLVVCRHHVLPWLLDCDVPGLAAGVLLPEKEKEAEG